jgi:hypothetical protein
VARLRRHDEHQRQLLRDVHLAAGLAEATEKIAIFATSQELGRLNEAGMEGMIMGFVDYNEELKYFGEKVLPVMKQAGLRQD